MSVKITYVKPDNIKNFSDISNGQFLRYAENLYQKISSNGLGNAIQSNNGVLKDFLATTPVESVDVEIVCRAPLS